MQRYAENFMNIRDGTCPWPRWLTVPAAPRFTLPGSVRTLKRLAANFLPEIVVFLRKNIKIFPAVSVAIFKCLYEGLLTLLLFQTQTGLASLSSPSPGSSNCREYFKTRSQFGSTYMDGQPGTEQKVRKIMIILPEPQIGGRWQIQMLNTVIIMMESQLPALSFHASAGTEPLVKNICLVGTSPVSASTPLILVTKGTDYAECIIFFISQCMYSRIIWRFFIIICSYINRFPF